MKPLSERLNERLEQENKHSWNDGGPSNWLASPIHTPNRDSEIDELVTLAKHLQSNPHLHADPNFAQQLERRLLVHQAALNRKQPARRWLIPHLWSMHPAFGMGLALCLLVLLLGMGVLVAAAQVRNADNPLYMLKRWEQHVQVSLANSPTAQAELDLQFARERLHSLSDLANPAHAEAYSQALADLDQQVISAASAISALPAGPEHDRLKNELASLDFEAHHTLRGFLPLLDVPERLLTTDELGRLGEAIPHLLSVEFIPPAHTNGHATISISGYNIQPGAQLLVDGQVMKTQGSFQNGLYVFIINWSGSLHPQHIGILNPDDTAAQTTVITIKNSTNENGGPGNNEGHGNGNNGGKPGKTPTPHH